MSAVTKLTLPTGPEPFYRGTDWTADDSIGHLLRQALSALSRGVEAEMQRCGLTSVQWAPLMLIAQSPNPTAASLARELNTDTGAMTRMLDRLEAKGLVTRRRSDADRRVVSLALTERGVETAQQIPLHLARVYNAQLPGFSAAEFETLKSFLRRIAGAAPGSGVSDSRAPAG